MAEYESVLLVKSEVFVYKIPPRTTNRQYRANEWNLDNPDWTGRMRLVSKGVPCYIKLEDKAGQLFAQCPIDTYPGMAVEAVNDSSRYFVIRIQDDNGRNAFIGIGFADRSDSFDLNVALQDHFKWVQKEQDLEKEKTEPPKQSLDLGFKEGQTIKINMKITKKDGEGSSKKARSPAGSMGGILPPPPAGGGFGRIAPPPPSPSHAPQPAAPVSAPSAPPSNNNTDWVQF